MVLKIDHISYSCADLKNIKHVIGSYTLEFEEKDLDNIACKRRFLKQNSFTHNIYMYHSQKDDIPVEITQYPSVEGYNDTIQFQSREIEWGVNDLRAAEELFICLGAKKSDDGEHTYHLKPFLEQRPLTIHFIEKQNASSPGYLDVEGWSSIGLFVDNVEKEAERIRKQGFFTTEVSPIFVNSKKLEIVFVQGKNGEMIELISLAKGNR